MSTKKVVRITVATVEDAIFSSFQQTISGLFQNMVLAISLNPVEPEIVAARERFDKGLKLAIIALENSLIVINKKEELGTILDPLRKYDNPPPNSQEDQDGNTEKVP